MRSRSRGRYSLSAAGRWVIPLLASAAFLLAGFVSVGHVGLADDHGASCGTVLGAHPETNHGDRRDRNRPSHDDGHCALCRVLALVPLTAALPAPLPAHEILRLEAPVSVPLAPLAAFLGFSLARGPPSSSLA